MNTLRSVGLAVTFFAGGVLVGCSPSDTPDVTRTSEGVLRLGSVEAVDTVSRAVDPKGRSLVLEGMRGSVEVRGDSTSTAALSFVQRGRGKSSGAARSALEGISITESGTERAYTFTLAAHGYEEYAAVEVRGQVPRDGSLRIDRISGPVSVDGLTGRLAISHEYGAVDVTRAAGPVNVDIKSGDVHVGFRSLPSEGTTHLRTANGHIKLRLPPDGNVKIDARTHVGTIRTRGVSLTPDRFGPIDAGAGYEAELGSGGPTIELRTENGSITLQQIDTTSISPGEKSVHPTPIPHTDTTVPPSPRDTIPADSTAADTV